MQAIHTIPTDTQPGARVCADLLVVRTRLRELVTPEEMNRWIAAENPVLSGRTPMEAIVQGDTDRVLEMLTQLEEGMHV